jgi:hypothetical protein
MTARLIWTSVVLLLAAAVAVLQQRQIAELRSQVEELRSGQIPLDLKRTMAWKQRYLDKAWHAGQAADWQAAGWYVRQVERMSDGVAEAGVINDNGPISQLEQAMLLPRFADLYIAVNRGNRAAFEASYRSTVQSCNACHNATQHSYVRITVPGEGAGGWNQRFEPSVRKE